MDKDHPPSHLLSPPPTEFPYPQVEHGKSDDGDIQAKSETTLGESVEAATVGGRVPAEHSDPPRPDLSSRRVATERPKPVGNRASILGYHRRATGLEAIKNTARDEDQSDDDSSSSSSSASDDVPVRRSWTQPDAQNTSVSHLNQVRQPKGHRAGSRGKFSHFALGDKKSQSSGKVRSDGRLAITVNEAVNSGYLAKALGLTLQHHLQPLYGHREAEEEVSPERKPPITSSRNGVPRMNIVIMVIGSRGDIQPFLKIGKNLKDKHGHRVRIATHPAFKDFVEKDIGLEFFSVGGDPSELMAFMVKNPGLIPSIETVRAGEIRRRRESMYEMFKGFWRACINATDDEKDVANLKMMGGRYVSVFQIRATCLRN